MFTINSFDQNEGKVTRNLRFMNWPNSVYGLRSLMTFCMTFLWTYHPLWRASCVDERCIDINVNTYNLRLMYQCIIGSWSFFIFSELGWHNLSTFLKAGNLLLALRYPLGPLGLPWVPRSPRWPTGWSVGKDLIHPNAQVFFHPYWLVNDGILISWFIYYNPYITG